jgi:putative MATE family efflux protein
MAVSMAYNIGAGILRAVGNSKTPFYILIVSGAANAALDLLFVGLFRWHVTGAAFATVLSQLLSAVLVFIVLLRTNLPCALAPSMIRFHSSELKKIIRLGLPIGIQSSLYPIANMTIQSNINQFGTNSIAAWAVCGKLDFLIWLVVDSLGAALSTFAAQNFGARHYSRVKRGMHICAGMSLLLVLGISAVLYVWCEPLGRLFINNNDVIAISTGLMRFLSPFYFLYIGGEILSAAIRGTGETFRPMLLTLTGTCACRILWIFFAVPRHPTLVMVIWSYPVSWLVTSLLFLGFYKYSKAALFT